MRRIYALIQEISLCFAQIPRHIKPDNGLLFVKEITNVHTLALLWIALFTAI
jgi:hypothetical protein